MSNHDLGISNGPVTLGTPTLTINPPSKPDEDVSKALPKEVDSKDVAANPDENKL